MREVSLLPLQPSFPLGRCPEPEALSYHVEISIPLSSVIKGSLYNGSDSQDTLLSGWSYGSQGLPDLFPALSPACSVTLRGPFWPGFELPR